MSEQRAHPNAALVQNVLDAMAVGDMETILDAYAEDGVYRVSGDNALSGTYRGRDAIRDGLMRFGAVAAGDFQVRVDDIVGDDGYAVMFADVSGERDGKRLRSTGVGAFKVNDDGKFTESWFLYSDQAAYDAFIV